MSLNYPVRSKRFAVQIQLGAASHELFYGSQIMNISKGGVFIKADLVLAVGSIIDFTFTLPKTNQTISVTGVVVWARRALSKQKDSFPHHPSGMGVQFVQTSNAVLDKINQELQLHSA
ncbi:PilZ domain-containing protein [bacterium]|nr:PilZ domain-containing protein [bacterium]